MRYLPLSVHMNEAEAWGNLAKAGLLILVYKEAASEGWRQFLQSQDILQM